MDDLSQHNARSPRLLHRSSHLRQHFLVQSGCTELQAFGPWAIKVPTQMRQ